MNYQAANPSPPAMDPAQMAQRADLVAGFLKGLASPQRLMVLCQLATGEQSVGALIDATGIAPTSMSQHLGKLKDAGLVTVRRDHRTLFYRISHPATLDLMSVLHRHFCHEATS